MPGSVFRLLRVPQWIKNVFVLVPLVFSKHLFHSDYFLLSLRGFFIFCLLSSSVYILNDIADREADAAHPKKKFRPIASGKISVTQAYSILGFLLLLTIISLKGTSTGFIFSAFFYFLLNIAYTFYFKHIVLMDIFCIAGGFMLRVISGAFILHVEISSWLILTTMFISLFLAVMKRRSELVLTAAAPGGITRKVLQNYNTGFLDQMATVTAAAVIICYALYTTATRTISTFHTENLIFTTPFVVFGIFRYMFLVYLHDQGENTTEIMVTDLAMIINSLLYIAALIVILYRVFPG